MSTPTIPEFFKERRVFITGATGFMGKVLVEKLLRSCNTLDTLYILVRGKKGKTAAQRWEQITNLCMFDRLKAEFPSALDTKVKILEGDVRDENMGLSDEIYSELVQNVDIIFHVAASVRFNDPLTDAIKMNTIGTKRVIDLATQIKNLLVVMHVSTTYCYCHQLKEIEEKVYPTDIDWRTAEKIVDGVDPDTLSILSQKFTNFAPNTYVYSKALAEQVVNDYIDRIPVVIFRPSIVIAAWKEPLPGWVDNFNGPIGLIIAGGKGVIRTALSAPDAIPDYMAVDIAIKAMIIAAWQTGVTRGYKGDNGLDTYNCSSTTQKSPSNKALLELCKIVHMESPMNEVLWSPSYAITSSRAMYRFQAFFSHFIFSLIVDTILRVVGKPPMLLKIHIKIHNAMMALGYFTTKEWSFKNARFKALNYRIAPEDKESFEFNFDDLEPIDYFRIAAVGGKKFLLNEDLDSLPQVKKKALRMYYIDKVVKWVVRLSLVWYVAVKATSFYSTW